MAMTSDPVRMLTEMAQAISGEDERIVRAAIEQLAATGVRRTSTDDIARRAGVNRATLYRRLGPKESIVGAAFLYETARVLGTIEAALGDPAEVIRLDEYVARFFIVTTGAVRENALLARMLEVDREQTLEALTAGAGEVITLAAEYLSGKIVAIRVRRAELDGHPVRTDDVDGLAAVLTRLTQSLLLTPSGPPRVDDEEQMRAFALTVLAPMICGR